MLAAQGFLGIFLYALILKTHGLPIKGSKSRDQRRSDAHGGGNFAAHRGAHTGRYAPMSYGVPGDFPRPMQAVGQALGAFQYAQTAPASGDLASMPGTGYPVGAGPLIPAPAGYPVGAGPFVPAPAGYPVGVGPLVPALAGYDASSTQTGTSQSNIPETNWAVAPKIFSEEGLANTQSLGPSASFPPPPPPPSGPVLQSGETSSVVKDAELGNYRHETEEFGYPAARMGPQQRFASPLLPQLGMGSFWAYPHPYPYVDFDYRLLYGLYPPGTYSTFSKHHEKGKDYNQDIHYLVEHGSDRPDVPNTPVSPSSGQQKKIFQRTP